MVLTFVNCTIINVLLMIFIFIMIIIIMIMMTMRYGMDQQQLDEQLHSDKWSE